MAIAQGVAIVGCGTVGGATAKQIYVEKENLLARTGIAIDLRYIVDINFDTAKKLGLPEKLYCSDLDKALADDSVGVVVELVGGLTYAKQVIEKALRAKKYVVTANKALLAHHGGELMALARSNGVSIAFEASCAGGIPVIRALYDGLIANRIDAMYGILNGTCNYILTRMIQNGSTYQDALKEAQTLGYAEANPSLDVSGGDTSHKLTILASLAFGKKIDIAKIPVSGIDTLSFIDVSYGLNLGYVVKMLAIAQRVGDGVSLSVRPSFISKSHPLAWVSGPFNALSIYGSATGHTMYYGRGAGGAPTASAVIADIMSILLGTYTQEFNTLKIWPDINEEANQLLQDEIKSRYYIRLMVADKPGVLAKIAEIMASFGISISSVLQPETMENNSNSVPIVIITHLAREGSVRSALAEANKLDTTKEPAIVISIVDERSEAISH